MLAGHEPAPGGVSQLGALAAHGLGDQRLLAARAGAEPEHRRVELDELQVRDFGAGPQREGDAVSGGDRRVRRGRVDLTEPAGGQHHGAGVHRADAVGLALAEHVQGHPGGPAVRR